MKAISLIQPWATLWALGIKICETRSWSTQFRGDILIHASKSDSEEGEALWSKPEIQTAVRRRLAVDFPPAFSELPRGAIIGKATIFNCVLMTEKMINPGKHNPAVICENGNRLPSLTFLTDLERSCGDWQKGRFAFAAHGHTLFDVYQEAKGQLGIWEFDPDWQKKERVQREQEKIEKRAAITTRRRRKKQENQMAEVQTFSVNPQDDIDPSKPVKRIFRLE